MTAPRGQHDDLFAEWQRWARTIAAELWLLQSHEFLWTRVRDALNEHQPDSDQTWLRHYSRVYADAQLMTLRRIAEDTTSTPTYSLAHLLRAMLRNRQVLTRQRFIDAEPMFPGGLPLPDTPEEAKRQYDSGHTFDQEYADDDGLVRATLIEEDLDRLAELVTDVKRRADQAIAHLDRNYDRDTDRALTYSDVRDAIASVVALALAGKWIYLLRGELPGNWRPQFATDWQEPLRAPVFRPST